jgi:hypothetical protein
MPNAGVHVHSINGFKDPFTGTGTGFITSPGSGENINILEFAVTQTSLHGSFETTDVVCPKTIFNILTKSRVKADLG